MPNNQEISQLLKSLKVEELDPRKGKFICDVTMLSCTGGTKKEVRNLVTRVDTAIQTWANAHLDRFFSRHPEIV